MSYLDVPRLHFYGTFTADPSTRNNTAANYNLPRDFPTSPTNRHNWNPDGSHKWAFVDCTVQTVIGPDGSPSQDVLVGKEVSSAATEPNSSPKLVDLDTQQQLVSMIFGLQIRVGDSASGSVSGYFQPQPFNDLFTPGQNGAYYQSVLQDLTWSSNLASPVLQELRKISPDTLSIKFDLKIEKAVPKIGMVGTITGTIGPASLGEPANFLLGRLMRPQASPDQPAAAGGGHAPPQRAVQMAARSNQPPNYTPFVVDSNRGKVIVDFGNSFSTFDQGTMQLAILPSQGPSQILGTVEYTQGTYRATAAIQEFDVTAEQLSSLQSSILGVLSNGSRILAEDESATSLAVTPMVCRLNPGESVQINLVALSFGAPAANQTIQIRIDNSQLELQNGPPPIEPPLGVPASVLQFPNSVTTDANGRASFTLTAAPKGPGNPRGQLNGQACYLDGQVYGIGFNWQLASNPDPWVFVSVHVYDHVSVIPFPDWENDVEKILLPYEDLYPFMARLVNLADPGKVLEKAQEIAWRLMLSEADPRHMPVTRDLSANKRQIVINWLQRQGGAGGTS